MLDKYGVELIGAKLPSIDRAEDRELFKQAMQRIGLKTPPRWVFGGRGLGVEGWWVAGWD
jgi:carbamoylphosphate synthase large subunit